MSHSDETPSAVLEALRGEMEELHRQNTQLREQLEQERLEQQHRDVELRASEARYAALAKVLLETSVDGIVLLDTCGNVIEASVSFARMLGYTPTEMTGLNLADWDAHWSEEELRQKAADTSPHEHRFETRHRRKDGTLYEVEISSNSVDWVDGQTVHFCICRDITERKQLERTLHASERRLNDILNNAIASIYSLRIGANREWEYEYQSAGCEPLCGYTATELMANKDLWLSRIPAEDLESVVIPAFDRILQGQTQTLEFRFRHKDGSLRWISGTYSSRYDATQPCWIVTGVSFDISDRKQAEVALKASEERLRTAMEAANMGSWNWQLGTNQIVWSESLERIMGMLPGTFDGQLETVIALIHPDDRQRVADALARSLEQNEPYDIEFRFIKPDGTIRWAASKGNVMRDADGRAIRMAGMDVDISDRKQAELALQQLNEELEERVERRTQALARSERDLRTIFNNVYDALFIQDMDGTILDVNDRALDMLGASRDQLIGAGIVDISGPAAPHALTPNLLSLAQTGEVLCFEWQCRRFDDNTFFDTEVTLRQAHFGDRTVLLAGVRDITARKRAEAALRESEERFRQIANNISEVFWLSTLDHTLLYVSPAFEQIWGRSVNDMTTEAWLETVHPDDRKMLLSQIKDSVGQLHPNGELEYRIIRPDGEMRWIRDRGFPVYDEQGTIHRIAGIAEDITDRKHLEQQRQRLLSVLEASPDHIGIAHPDGRLIWNNRQAKRFRGLPLNTDVTQMSVDIYHPQWAQDVVRQQAIPTALQEGIWMGETALLTGEGEEIPVSQLVWAHRSETGEVEYISSIIRDISDLKRAEQSLREVNADLENRVAERTAELVETKEAAESANRAKSTFLANMSHELRTPLNAILGFSQLMGRDPALSQKHLEELKIINRSGEHLLTLINDILQMSKIEAGKVALMPSTVELAQLLNDLAAMLRFKAEAKELTFTINCHPQLPRYICIDGHKLRQVLLNLLSNAIKFTQSGHVVLRVEPGRNPLPNAPAIAPFEGREFPILSLHFEVEDSGVGIAPEEIDLLFEPFAQTASGRLSQEGTGLGLPISHQFVQLMGGHLEVSSRPGVGSTFAFEIPVQVIEADGIEAIATPQQVIAIAPGQPEYRILVVEDNWANRVLLQNLLHELGFAVQTAVNGQEAIACWQTWHPHLIFMDIRMPEMNGRDATLAIRQLEQSTQTGTAEVHSTKIICLTAGVLEDPQTELASVGFNDFVVKPIQENTITRLIAQQLGVQYVYATDHSPLASSSSSVDRPLTTKVLQTLPMDWLRQFHDSIAQLYQEDMLELIAQLPAEHAEVAQMLTCKVHEFDYELLLNLTQSILAD